MSPGQFFIMLFLMLLSVQLGLSMEMPFVIVAGCGLSVVAALKWVTVERPTWGLVLVLFAAGGLVGSQLLEEIAAVGSWVESSSLFAGLLLSMQLYLLWRFAASDKSPTPIPVDRDAQTILVWGLLLMLLMAPPEAAVLTLFGTQVALVPVVAVLLACLVLIADRCAGYFFSRLLLLLPVLLLLPLSLAVLGNAQGPVVAALANMLPQSRGYTSTGFSPNQRMDASVFLRPSNRAVMRIDAAELPNRYLAGNRLVELDTDLVWQPAENTREFLTLLDAENLPTGEWRFEIDNHHTETAVSEGSLLVHGLKRDNYIFVNPGTSHVTGNFDALTRNASDVWTPAFDRGGERRWQLEIGGNVTPDSMRAENLQLPAFWDQALQDKSESFVGTDNQQTVDNVLAHFMRMGYSLQTSFDEDQPFHDFFLNDKAGYCFWFASAATLALRANDIPSRLVSGYVVHERLSERLWLVRERDAHSWVEWQDPAGYWHTIDPTPPSIVGFFDGYQSSPASQWYHYLAGQWQILIDRILADEFTANAVRYGGLLILLFLFVREYRRIRVARNALNTSAVHWQKLWSRFLGITRLPANAAWTASTYADNLPAEWPESWRQAVREFLQRYSAQRFSRDEQRALQELEAALRTCQAELGK